MDRDDALRKVVALERQRDGTQNEHERDAFANKAATLRSRFDISDEDVAFEQERSELMGGIFDIFSEKRVRQRQRATDQIRLIEKEMDKLKDILRVGHLTTAADVYDSLKKLLDGTDFGEGIRTVRDELALREFEEQCETRKRLNESYGGSKELTEHDIWMATSFAKPYGWRTQQFQAALRRARDFRRNKQMREEWKRKREAKCD